MGDMEFSCEAPNVKMPLESGVNGGNILEEDEEWSSLSSTSGWESKRADWKR